MAAGEGYLPGDNLAADGKYLPDVMRMHPRRTMALIGHLHTADVTGVHEYIIAEGGRNEAGFGIIEPVVTFDKPKLVEQVREIGFRRKVYGELTQENEGQDGNTLPPIVEDIAPLLLMRSNTQPGALASLVWAGTHENERVQDQSVKEFILKMWGESVIACDPSVLEDNPIRRNFVEPIPLDHEITEVNIVVNREGRYTFIKNPEEGIDDETELLAGVLRAGPLRHARSRSGEKSVRGPHYAAIKWQVEGPRVASDREVIGLVVTASGNLIASSEYEDPELSEHMPIRSSVPSRGMPTKQPLTQLRVVEARYDDLEDVDLETDDAVGE